MKDLVSACLLLVFLNGYAQLRTDERLLLKKAKVSEIVIAYTSTKQGDTPAEAHVWLDTSGLNTKRLDLGNSSKDSSLTIYEYNANGSLHSLKTTSNDGYSYEMIYIDSTTYREAVKTQHYSDSSLRRTELRKGTELNYRNDTLESTRHSINRKHRQTCKIVYYNDKGQAVRILRDRHYYDKQQQQYKLKARLKNKRSGKYGKRKKYRTQTRYLYDNNGLLKQTKTCHSSDKSITTADYRYITRE